MKTIIITVGIVAAIAAVWYCVNSEKQPETKKTTNKTAEFRHTVELDDFDAHWLELETLEYRYELEFK
jgi:hypothetical protein